MALGCDMFDCVFPTRTAVSLWAAGVERGGCQGGDGAREGEDLDDLPFLSPFVLQRFGSALVSTGNLQLKKKQFQKDFRPIDPECTCATCQK